MAHYFDGKDYYADTDFINSTKNALPGMKLEHLGFGEMELTGSKGTIEFDRMRGKDFPGQSGRSHKLYDDKNGKLIEELIKAMERSGKSELVEATNSFASVAEACTALAKEGEVELAQKLARAAVKKT